MALLIGDLVRRFSGGNMLPLNFDCSSMGISLQYQRREQGYYHQLLFHANIIAIPTKGTDLLSPIVLPWEPHWNTQRKQQVFYQQYPLHGNLIGTSLEQILHLIVNSPSLGISF